MRSGSILFLLLVTVPAQTSETPQIQHGDRVVFLGNTLIEREQRYGYWETAITRLLPGKKIQFRNLGWSGDTVFGEARAGFGSVADGFKQLQSHTLSLKPTVLLLGYGTNESFQGQPGLATFLKGCQNLINTLAPLKPRYLWLSPLQQEKLPPPLPNPEAANRNLSLYGEAIRQFATEHQGLFLDLYHLDRDPSLTLLTDNGIHLTAEGYWFTAPKIAAALGLKDRPWRKTFNTGGKTESSWDITDDYLPFPAVARETIAIPENQQRILRIENLPEGNYTLSIDGKSIQTAEAKAWAQGVRLTKGPEFDQVEELRKAIIAKNRLYFHRWRPQNETYLFGFRKHEQGNNAVEIPKFDPLVEAREAEIVNLSQPRKHTYQIIKQGASK